MNIVYSIMEYTPISIIVLGLIMHWKVLTARWFLLTYGVLELIDLNLLPMALSWNTHYYLYCIVMSIAFVLPIVYGRSLAYHCYNVTGINYFRQVYERKTALSSQECSIILVITVSCLANMLTWLEVLAYKYDFISTALFKLYFRDNIMLALHVLLCIALMSYTVRAGIREEDYLRHEGIK